MLDRAYLFPRTLKPLALALGLALTAALAASACTKTEGQSSASDSGTATSAPSATPSGATTTTTPAIDASPSTIAPDTSAGITPGGSAAAPVASAIGSTKTTVDGGGSGAVAASASATAGAAQCGTKPLPDCPLQAWMKANTNPAIASSDLPGLATALDKTAGFAPAGYTNWASISKDGAKAARGGDMTAAKASCRTCHDQYKDKYKKEMRARKI